MQRNHCGMHVSSGKKMPVPYSNEYGTARSHGHACGERSGQHSTLRPSGWSVPDLFGDPVNRESARP